MSELELLTLAAAKYDYNPETGVFVFKHHRQPSRIGKSAGSWKPTHRKNHTNYYKILNIVVGGVRKTIYGHRLAWFIVYNEVPKVIDHIDHTTSKDDSNNRISNLRSVTTRQNASRHSTTGYSEYVGVSWDKSREKWYSSIRIAGGSNKFLGRFDTELEAAEAYQKALNNM